MSEISKNESEANNSYGQALKGGCNVLNREERTAFYYTLFVVVLLTMLVGMEIGGFFKPDESIHDKPDLQTELDSNVTITHKIDPSRLADWEEREVRREFEDVVDEDADNESKGGYTE